MSPQNPLEKMTKFDQDPVGARAGVRDQRARGRLSQADYREKVEVGGPCEGRHQPSQGLQSLGRVGRGAWQPIPRVWSRAVEMRTPFFPPCTTQTQTQESSACQVRPCALRSGSLCLCLRNCVPGHLFGSFPTLRGTSLPA